ncbi:UDP-N-acetylglucosamine--N-acetylmuramyl-(pentapeptide) pyrophosphoryl-undecaprenol N-acetylglucosamine transferase [Streptomyces sioyaensis]|uniref:UDP-N-acetylglucosamine--N-acetylmuramyl- (pentapeptide) pyrophosphoryl-undecaprenol N-acetylglucosamine transferase n=1 Tax=Streptomyces sioyaensis TaxID=67364 RepID=UPI0037BBCBDD
MNADSALSVVIGAGGTGGHIYPGLALAGALRRAVPDVRIHFIGTERGLEGKLIPQAGYALHTVDMIPFERELGLRRYLLPAYLVRASAQARTVLLEQGAHIAVGMGGYPSAPVIVGARRAGVPSLIHESNAVPGRANRLSARLTPHVALAFEQSRARLPRSRARTAGVVGMPLSGSLTRLNRQRLYDEARAWAGLRPSQRLILVNGGSLGAQRLTDAALGLAWRWRHRTDVRLLIKTGPDALPAARQRLQAEGGAAVAEAVAYLDRMDLAYAAADLAVCRAGSATVAELASVGLPAVLVPLPHAPGDHQTHNARVLVDQGAALLLANGQVGPMSLASLIEPLLADPEKLAAMSGAADPGSHTQAAELLAQRVLALAGRATAEAA